MNDTIALANKYIEAHKAHASAWAALGNVAQLEDAGDQSLFWQSVQEAREKETEAGRALLSALQEKYSGY